MKKRFNIIIIICLILGIIDGFVIPETMNNISFIGTIYVNLLKFIIVPILFTNIVVTIYNSKMNNAKILVKTVTLFVIMFVCSFLITSLIVLLFNSGTSFTFKEVAWNGELLSLNLSDIIVNLFPSNLSTMISNNYIFAIILVSLIFGISASQVENGDKAIQVIDGFKNIFNKILEYILYLTPIAVFSLMGSTVATYGKEIINTGLKYILLSYLCGIVVLILVMILPVWLFAKINPIKYIKKIYKVWIITLTTCSSMATLPTTIKTCNEELNIPEKITNIVVPLGCTIHMCGGAVSFALLGIFCSQLYGVDISITTFFTMIISSTLINMAAPGIPGGGIVIGATYLTLLNIPLTFIGFYSGVYRILDMNYTTLNVSGDITANVLIHHFEKKK